MPQKCLLFKASILILLAALLSLFCLAAACHAALAASLPADDPGIGEANLDWYIVVPSLELTGYGYGLAGKTYTGYYLSSEAKGASDRPMKITHWSPLFLGGLVFGEAVALTIGMHGSAWLTPGNKTLLVIDLLTGAGLIVLSLIGQDEPNPALTGLLTTVVLLSHGYREWEYLSGQPNPFCANKALFVMNNVKLALSLLSIGVSIAF